MTKYGEWKIWNGGECPCPGKRVQWQIACSTRFASRDTTPIEATALNWGHDGSGSDIIAYREVIEPVRETVTLFGNPPAPYSWKPERSSYDTHRITFDLLDGEPDCSSIRMEKL